MVSIMQDWFGSSTLHVLCNRLALRYEKYENVWNGTWVRASYVTHYTHMVSFFIFRPYCTV